MEVAGEFMAAALIVPANPNPTPNPTSSLRPPSRAASSVLRFPRRDRARTHLTAAFGRGSPAAAAERGGKDYYATLNLRRDATLQEVKTAYRTLARKVLHLHSPPFTLRCHVPSKC